MKRLFATMLLASLALAGPLQSARADEAEHYDKQKVVYHVNFDGGEKDKLYRSTLGNILNHVNAVGADNLDLRVVMNGDGVNLLRDAKKDPDLGQRVANLKAQNVRFEVCNNTLKSRKIDYEKDLYDVWKEDIVPSGVAEVAKLQLQGFAYIKTY